MMTYDEMLSNIQQLPPEQKARLLQDISAALHRDLAEAQPKQPKRSLLGLWAGVDISEADIEDARRDMWDDFPRGDI